MGYDLRLAFASLRREPVLATLVVVILAVSLGVHTAVFSLIHAAFFRPLPYPDADRLVIVESVYGKTGGAYGLSLPDADDFRREAESLTEIGAFSARRDNLVSREQRVTSVPSAVVTAGVLRATGVTPVLGRLFTPEDDSQGADTFKVVISHSLWRSYFGSDPKVLGKNLQTSLGTYTVIGVLPSGFAFPEGSELWFPYQNWVDTQRAGETREGLRGRRWSQGLAQLGPNYTLEQAQAELTEIAAGLGESLPAPNADWRPRLTRYRESTTLDLAPYLRSLFVMTWVFMILAAVNLASLQLARGVARAGSFSLQLALGASGRRLGRQLLFESLILTVPGAVAGIGVASALLALLPQLIPSGLPPWLELRLGLAEIGFTALVAVLVALVAGLAPLVIGRRLDLRSLLAGRGGASMRGTRLRTTLVVVQVSLATVLVVTAILLSRSFDALERINPGFDYESVVSVELSPQVGGSNPEQRLRLASLFQRIQSRLLEVPGVEALGGTTHLPYLDRDRRLVTLVARGGEDEEAFEHQTPSITIDITPGYFESMGIPIKEGRDFTWLDSREQGLVIILSQRAADLVFPGQPAIGKEVRITNDTWARVVGVVGDVRYDPREPGYGAELYYPITQYKAWRQRLAVRLDGPQEAVLPSLRAALQEAAPEAGLVTLRSLGSILDDTLWESRLLGRLAPLLAAVALLLATLGVYGLLVHDLAQKRQELGLRAALGAPRHSLAGLVCWRGMRLVLLGAVAGAGIALLTAPLLAASLFGIEAKDPTSFSFAVIALFLAGTTSCLAPAWRAMGISPTEAMRDV